MFQCNCKTYGCQTCSIERTYHAHGHNACTNPVDAKIAVCHECQVHLLDEFVDSYANSAARYPLQVPEVRAKHARWREAWLASRP